VKVTVEDGSGKVTIEPGAAKATWDGETVAGVVVKADADRQFTLGVAYPADKADTAVASDGHRDFASKSAVETAAWNFMKNGAAIGLHHMEGTDGAGTVVESYIYRGPDWIVKSGEGSQCVIKEGDWLVGTVWSDDAWAQISDGRIGGVSMQGRARRRNPAPESLANLRE